LTPLGWCAAGPTLPPVAGDPFFNIVADNFVAKQNALYKTQLSSIQRYVGKTEIHPVTPSTWNYVNAITTSQHSHLRPLFTVQARVEHLDKLVKTFWLDQSTPTDDDMAMPIREDILMQQIKKSLIILPNGQ
jgi:hypothetical protein